MLDNEQYRELILRPANESINLYCEDSEELLVATLANESDGGRYLKEKKGPALGIFQMEPETYDALWEKTISKDLKLSTVLLNDSGYSKKPPIEVMIFNLRYATQMARIKYFDIQSPLPNRHNLLDIWTYYKRYYNSYLGKATKDEFILKYKKFIGI